MKRVIAIGVVFALVAGAAFAATTVGATFEASVNFLKGNSGVLRGVKYVDGVRLPEGPGFEDNYYYNDDQVVFADGGVGNVQFSVDYTSEDSTVGGRVRLKYNGSDFDWQGSAWWQPLDLFMIVMRQDDGGWGVTDIGGLYHDNVGPVYKDIGDYSAFPGGFNKGLGIKVSPIPALSFAVGVPFFAVGLDRAENVFKKTWGQVSFDIDGIGTVGLTVSGDLTTAGFDKSGSKKVFPDGYGGGIPGFINPTFGFYNDNPELGLSFKLTAVDNLTVILGVNYKIANVVEDESDFIGGTKLSVTATKNNPFKVGLGARYTLGAFSVALRTQFGFGDGYKVESKISGTGVTDTNATIEVQDPFLFSFGVIPSYAVTDQVKIFLNIGVDYRGVQTTKVSGKISGTEVDFGDNKEVKKQDQVAFVLNPYGTINVGNGLTFKIGFWMAAYTNYSGVSPSINIGDSVNRVPNKDKQWVDWAIPIAVGLSF